MNSTPRNCNEPKAEQLPESICETCGKACGYLNIRKEHWCFCSQCMTKWHIGTNLFSGWQSEDQDLWNRNAEALEFFDEAKTDTLDYSVKTLNDLFG